MKKVFFTLIVMLANILSANELPVFNENYFIPNVILVAFESDAIGSTRGEISITRSTGNRVNIGLTSFDQISDEYNFTDIERVFVVDDYSFKTDSGTHLMNIFRIYVEDNDDMDNALYELSNDPNVLWAEFEEMNVKFNVSTDDVNQYWDFNDLIQLQQMWNSIDIEGSEVIVAIIDDGVKWNHTYLRPSIFVDWEQASSNNVPNVVDWKNGFITYAYSWWGSTDPETWSATIKGDIIGWNWFGNRQYGDMYAGTINTINNQSFQSYFEIRYGDVWKQDHGTHVAGIVKGVIGKSSLEDSVKLLISRHSSNKDWDGVIWRGYHGILYAADRGAHIINCSWGSIPRDFFYDYDVNFVNAVVDYATNKGSLVIASAGNRGHLPFPQGIEKRFPAAANNAIAVAASDGNERAYFSQHGDWIDIIAPGVSIYSTSYHANGQNIYDSYSGTSMSAPIVSGIAAAIRSLYPDLSPLQVKHILTSSLSTDEFANFDGIPSAGRVNAYKAIETARDYYFIIVDTTWTNLQSHLLKKYVVTDEAILTLSNCTILPSSGDFEIVVNIGKLIVNGGNFNIGNAKLLATGEHSEIHLNNLSNGCSLKNIKLLDGAKLFVNGTNVNITGGMFEISGQGSGIELN